MGKPDSISFAGPRDQVLSQRRHRGLLVVGLVVAAVVGWLALRPGGPTYRGKGIGYYYPSWVWPSARRSGRMDRLPDDAGPEAVGFLIQVLHLADSKAHRWLVQSWDRLPQTVRDPLPEPVSVDGAKLDAFDRLASLVGQRAGMTEVVDRFEVVPDPYRAQLLYCMARYPALTNCTLPLFRSSLREGEPELRAAAVTSVLVLGEAGLPLFPEVLANLNEAQLEGREAGARWEAWCVYLGRLGAAGRGAVPILERLRDHPGVQVRIKAQLAMARIEKDPSAIRRMFEREVVPQGADGIQVFLAAVRLFAPMDAGLFQTDETLPIWISLVSGSQLNHWLISSTAFATNQMPNGKLLENQGRDIRWITVDVIGAMGVNAAPCADLLVGLLDDPDPFLRRRALQALKKVGPVAPDSLPRLISAMSDTSYHLTLIPLLGAYGPLASNAVPELEILAAGQYRPGWTNRDPPALEGEALKRLMERYGLRPAHGRAVTSSPAAAEVRSYRFSVPREVQVEAWKALRKIEPGVDRPFPEHLRASRQLLQDRYGVQIEE